MNLIIDAGNTQIKWAVYDSSVLLVKQSVDDWSDLDLSDILSNYPEIVYCIVSSTREYSSEYFLVLENYGVNIYWLTADTPLPMKIAYKTPQSLGLDRIAGAVGGLAEFPGHAVLIIDMGTAITYDLVSANAVFVGGNISPGLEIRFLSLHRYTDKLPLVEFDDQEALIGTSTSGAIRAGVQNGIVYELNSHINALKNKYKGLRVILTGGSSEYFVKKLKKPIFVNPSLVLKGLNHILEHQIETKGRREN
ncbi:MAG: type III pantothenate kinase [Bacteroidales bacterium]|nr:type III pantothenate kinase [Bacteroidales bacterium]